MYESALKTCVFKIFLIQLLIKEIMWILLLIVQRIQSAHLQSGHTTQSATADLQLIVQLPAHLELQWPTSAPACFKTFKIAYT